MSIFGSLLIKEPSLGLMSNVGLLPLGCLPEPLRCLAKEGEDAMWGSLCGREMFSTTQKAGSDVTEKCLCTDEPRPQTGDRYP